MGRTVFRWMPERFGRTPEKPDGRFAGTRTGSGLQEELSTNPLIFQHSPAGAPETLDGRGSPATFDPGPQQTTGPPKTQFR